MNDISQPQISLLDAIGQRRSVRGFLDKPVDDAIIEQIFSQAQLAPSNCNTQPWKVYVASGGLRDTIREKMIAKAMSGAPATPDFDYKNKFEGDYRQRQVDCAVAMYGEMGIGRNDREGRMKAGLRNFELFDAPHVVFFGMEKHFGATIALDVGMYAQTLMLMMTAFGIGSCAMGSLRNYPDVVRQAFGIDDSVGVLFGMVFGYEDNAVLANNTRMDRIAVADSVVFQS